MLLTVLVQNDTVEARFTCKTNNL